MRNVVLWFSLFVQDDKAVEEALEKFKAGYRSPEVESRASAVALLAATKHDKILNRLASYAMSDANEVRIAAIKGIGGFKENDKAVPMLAAALGGPNTKEREVRIAVMEAFGSLQNTKALPTVHQAFTDKSYDVAKAAIAAAGAIGGRDSMDALLKLMKDVQKAKKAKQSGGYFGKDGLGDERAQQGRLDNVIKEILKAFQTITKEKWTTVDEWEIWWKRNKSTFQVPK